MKAWRLELQILKAYQILCFTHGNIRLSFFIWDNFGKSFDFLCETLVETPPKNTPGMTALRLPEQR